MLESAVVEQSLRELLHQSLSQRALAVLAFVIVLLCFMEFPATALDAESKCDPRAGGVPSVGLRETERDTVLAIGESGAQAGQRVGAEPEQGPPTDGRSSPVRLSEKETAAIGARVWKNECGGRIDGLTSWNVGEGFPSLGIGHFIWYPENARDRFEESFPKVVSFLQENGAVLPKWLTPDTHCPWTSREEFLADAKGQQMTELRQFLANTVALQTKYIIRRLEGALPVVLEKAPAEERPKLTSRFYKVLSSGYLGAYALIDYVNFKGEGVSDSERYKGQGWGLLQVLEEMSDSEKPLPAFASSATFVLTRRVKNSPPERHEERWLPGWKNRINTYTAG